MSDVAPAPEDGRNYPKNLLEDVRTLLLEVSAEIILPYFRNLDAADIDTKSSEKDLVTIADRKSEVFLEDRLARLLPDCAIVGEEAAYADPAILDRLTQPAPVWVIDPVDGTGNFSRGHKRFGILIALVHRGQTVAGWIHDPLTETTVGGWQAGPVQRWQGWNGLPEPLVLNTDSSTAPDPTDLQVSLNHPGTRPLAKSLPGQRAMGSAAHVYLSLLTGELDACLFSRSAPWDHAAGLMLIAAAGGITGTLTDGTPYQPANSTQVALLSARSPQIWTAMQTAVLEVLQD